MAVLIDLGTAGVPHEGVDILTVFPLFKDVNVTALAILDVDDSLDQFVVLLNSLAIPLFNNIRINKKFEVVPPLT